MKLLLVVLMSAMALPATSLQAKKKPAPKTARKETDISKPMAIPADAVQDASGDYRYTDPQGKKWIYRKTPFGVSRLEETPENANANAAGKAAGAAGIKATEDGDMVRFERLGPFGVWKWEKKKSELDETEKAALENSQAGSKTASKQD